MEGIIFDKCLSGNREKRSFDDLEIKILGNYVYVLRDPRDGKVFYVGQGTGNRVFGHFQEAEVCLKDNKKFSSKIIRILDIWNNDEDVDWAIVAHKLPEKVSDYVESSVYDALSISQNGISLNEIEPPHSSFLFKEDISLSSAKPVNPDIPLEKVFVFPIKNTYTDKNSIYEATRRAWNIKKEFQYTGAGVYAVGIKNSISRGSFIIDKWSEIENNQELMGKLEFAGKEDKLLENKNWREVVSKVKGYWQRGNYLIVTFDGKGKFSFLRGGNKGQWFDCVPE